MSQYYFLVASLPLLSYDNRDTTEPSEFLEMLGDHLGEREIDLVRQATIDAPGIGSSGHETIDRWNEFERGVRNALVRLRAQRRNADASESLRLDDGGGDATTPTEIGDAARDAFNHDSPLSGEDVLNRARWEFLDELEVGHFFDLERIIIYYLKLQLIARRRGFRRDEGERKFAEITEQIINDYYQEQDA